MRLDVFSGWGLLGNAAPLFAAPFFIIFYLQRAFWRRKKRLGKKNLGFSASTFSLGIALQNLEMLIRPSVDYVIEEKYDEDADEDDQGDPDDPDAQLNRQLKRIRRGETVERLVLRLK